jgi:hypothetical protein
VQKLFILSILIIQSFLGFAQGFEKLNPKESGIDFTNALNEDDTINGLSYLYLYNGGGVAIGDINNDGLEDIYFTGNQTDDKLYLNQGDLKFKDVTKKYFKKQCFDFHTGATMVDINNDGWLDIYVSCAGYAYDGDDRRNKLFINQEGKGFINEAKEYGLDDSLNTTQAAFFDADNDGDLDVYLLNHVYLRKNTQYRFQFNKMKKVMGDDRLMINDNGHFTDKSKELGIESSSYGQGVIVSDFNQDGWQDIYVANDFEEGDKFFINNGGKSFEEKIQTNTMHTPLFSMGADAADINNDGLIDFISVDMASEDHVKSKKNMGGMSSDNFWKLVESGQHYQYMFNALQLNTGSGFIDIAQMAGVSKTDWSWSSLFADFDNDGFQDLYVSNGYFRELRDNDFVLKYDRKIQISKEFMSFEELSKLIPSSKTPNYIFRNNGDLTFDKKSSEWGLNEAITVNGASYADLDNDGDLDIICNASNEVSFILENKSSKDNHFLKVNVTGTENNIAGLGTRIELYYGSNQQVREVQPSRGYQSGVSNTLHFGLGETEKVDSVIVRFNGVVVDAKMDVSANQTLKVEIKASNIWKAKNYSNTFQILEKVELDHIPLKHTDISYDDFEKEVLLPHKMSQLGPFLNVDDLNGDGLDDIYFPAARGSKGTLLVQDAEGNLIPKHLEFFKSNFLSEEMGTVFFDADNDGDKDVYVVTGSNEMGANDASYQDQLYLNNGKETFSYGNENLPKNTMSGQKVIAKDLNSDGWMDLVVFGRQTPGNYPAPANSIILLNEGGKFVDKTYSIAPEFDSLGMVTDAIFVNIDEDSDEELIIVGEWMPVTIFDFIDGRYVKVTEQKGLANTVGWWNTIELYEDEDGVQKFLLGNIGLNNKYHPTKEGPLHLYMADFDDNGSNDIVLAKAQNNILYPIRGRQCTAEQMPFIAQKFLSYDLFAVADVNAIYSSEKLEQALHLEAHTFANSLLTIENGEIRLTALPNEFQTGTINQFVVDDFDKDGKNDFFSFGNKFEAEVETERYDGNPSLYCSGKDNFMNPKMLGIIENVKSAARINIKEETYIILGINNGFAQTYKVNL